MGEDDVTERAKFARLCVEVDLRKSFVSKFKVGLKSYNVGYEGLHLFCFSCGMYGHKKESCGVTHARKKEEEEAKSKAQEPAASATPELKCDPQSEVEAFGSWMVVQRAQKGRKLKSYPASMMAGKEKGATPLAIKVATSVASPRQPLHDVKGVSKKEIYEEGKGKKAEINSPMTSNLVSTIPKRERYKERKGNGGMRASRNPKGALGGTSSSGKENQQPSLQGGHQRSGKLIEQKKEAPLLEGVKGVKDKATVSSEKDKEVLALLKHGAVYHKEQAFDKALLDLGGVRTFNNQS